MANLKAIISKNVGTSLTTAYTNSTGQDAALKAFNVNHIGDSTAPIYTDSGAGVTYGFLGNAISFADNAGNGYNIPYCVKLGEDKLLLLYSTNYVYNPNDFTAEAQVVEWDGAKYINYPSARLNFNMNLIGANNTNPEGLGIHAVALSSSKVAVVTLGGLYVLTITNNVVDTSIQSLVLSSVFNTSSHNAIKIQPVPGNTNKVVLYGWPAGATTSLTASAFNVPTGSAPTQAGSAQTVFTGVPAGNYAFDFCLHRRIDPTYFFAGFTAASTISGSILTFNDATNVWTVAAATATINAASADTNTPVITVPLSTDGSSSYNTVVVTGSASSVALLRPYLQTSGTSISSTAGTTLSLNNSIASSSRSLYWYNLGNRKAIIGSLANGVLGVDDSGTLTSLMPITPQDANLVTLILPFSSRPLYFYTPNTADFANLIGRTGLTATGFGSVATTGNYIAYGHPNGKAYAWSSSANCWFAVQGETLYALDVNGNILAERKLNIASSLTQKVTAKAIAIAPNGNIGIASDAYLVALDSTASLNNNVSTGTPFAIFTYVSTASGITSPSQITSATVTNTTFTGASNCPRKVGDLLILSDSSGVYHLVMTGLRWSTNTSIVYYVATVATPNTAVSSVAGTALTTPPNAAYMNSSLFVTSPTVSGSSSANVTHVGATFAASASVTGYLSYTTAPQSYTNPTLIWTQTGLSTSANDPYVPCVSRTQSGMSAIMGGSLSANSLYLWTSFNNTAVASAYTISSMNNALKPEVMSAQNMTIICNGASATTAITPFFQLWGRTSLAPYASGNGTATSWAPLNIGLSPTQYQLSANGNGVNITYSSPGSVNTTFSMAVNNGTDDFYVTGTSGSTIVAGNNYRSEDVYYVPAGGSIKIQANAPRQLDVMLEVLEQ